MDIYFTPELEIVNTYIEEGKPRIFEYECEKGHIRNQFILREIPWKIDVEQYYDIASSYRYGGLYIRNCIDWKQDALLHGYENTMIAAGFYICFVGIEEYLHISPAYAIKYAQQSGKNNMGTG